MHYWTMAEINRLREEVAKGKAADLKGFAKSLGVEVSACRSVMQRYRMRPLKLSQSNEPGVECQVCGDRFLWSEMSMDDPVALVVEVKKWRQAHLLCRGK